MLMPNQMREALCENAVKTFGYEHPYTILCFQLCTNTKVEDEYINDTLKKFRDYYLAKEFED